jgi:glycosyltransferase involved in cell wall biosynthesis
MRSGEKVLEALCKIFPKADIFTIVCDPDAITDTIKSHRIQTSWIQKFPGAVRHYRHYLPLFPLAIEQFDLSAYDLVISSDASVCKGVLTQPETCHICYCHTPVRYAWAYPTYLNLPKVFGKETFHSLPATLGSDHSASSRVDYFIANSGNVARRIHKYYRRESTILYPPIRVGDFQVGPSSQEYFLAAGELTPYKRLDLAVRAFNRMGLPLWIGRRGARKPEVGGHTIRFRVASRRAVRTFSVNVA